MVLKLSSPAPGSTPKLWSLLQKVSQTQEKDKKCTKKLSDLVSLHSTLLLYSRLIGRGAQIILSMIFQLMYAQLHNHNCWPKFLSTFLCAQEISVKSLDLHAFGLTMLHKWLVRTFTTISVGRNLIPYSV
ncbi:hypothetical protein PAXRUDRAFT_792989 [Paxillus rubicundulus Ve08.2h10]|uniref:Uncharacterized protein n=1 Tax=Paxillus rubicundulus Ve08.2h10 TaxID=930991 RepID=A0A0D0DU82_9AGAM|nr:hypothetical protein PAXRUDRAFT_792989 [Paxillus rubicundulus Ve08.2h10]